MPKSKYLKKHAFFLFFFRRLSQCGADFENLLIWLAKSIWLLSEFEWKLVLVLEINRGILEQEGIRK